MFTIKVDLGSVIIFRHFATREAMGEGARADIARGRMVLAMFLPGEVVA